MNKRQRKKKFNLRDNMPTAKDRFHYEKNGSYGGSNLNDKRVHSHSFFCWDFKDK